jgi:hypothetical protein
MRIDAEPLRNYVASCSSPNSLHKVSIVEPHAILGKVLQIQRTMHPHLNTDLHDHTNPHVADISGAATRREWLGAEECQTLDHVLGMLDRL